MRKHWMTVAAGLLAAVVTLGWAGEARADFVDNFDQATFDARWGLDVPNAGLGNVTLDTGGDQAHFEAFGNTDMWGSRNNAPILWTPSPAGNFYLETHVKVPTNQGTTVAGLTVYGNADGSKPDFSLGLDHWNVNGRIVKLQGLGTNNPNVATANTGGEAGLRLECIRDGGAGGVDRYIARFKRAQTDPWFYLATLDRDVANDRMGLVQKTGGGGRSSDFTYAAGGDLVVAGPPAPVLAGKLWSVDIQGAGSSSFGQQNPPLLMAGPDPVYGIGNVWNAFDVPGHNLPAAANPTKNLVDSDGNASPVNFTLIGSAAGFSNGSGHPLFKDYVFDSAGNAGPEYNWEITGLTPGASYDLALYGGVARAADMKVDVDGDGDLSNNVVRQAPANSAIRVPSIVADATGKIIGNMGVGVGGEQNWSGFQLAEAAPVVGTVWSVDIQGAGSALFGQSNPPLTMSGPDPFYGFGKVWNAFNVPGHNLPVQNDPSIPLVDSNGNPTGVTFTVHGPTAGWGGSGASGGKLDLTRDYLFVDAGNVGGVLTADWTLSGLDPTHLYEMFAYGGVGRDMQLAVDLDGDGLGNDFAQLVDGTGLLFGPITPDAQGNIIGVVANGTGDAEGNWSGFQLRDITPTGADGDIPEPATMALLGLAVAALGTYTRRRKMISTAKTLPLWIAAILTVGGFLAAPAGAATIDLAGTIQNDAGNEISQWRTPGTPKSLDADGDNVYGSDAKLFYKVMGDYGTYVQYITSDSQVGPYGGYAVVDHPNDSSPDIQVRTTTSGGVAVGSVQDMFTFAIPATPPPLGFRVGIAFDGLNGAQYSPQEIRLTQTTGGAASASVNVEPFRDNTLDMAFFDVKGAAVGDRFTVQGVAGAGGYATHQIVTWDAIKAPPAPLAGGDVIKLDFSTAGDGDGGSLFDWNQVDGTGANIPAGSVIRHGDGSVIPGVGISFNNFIAGRVNNDGASANWGGTAADPYYVLGADDIYFHGSGNDLEVTFSGLDPSLTYNARFYSLIGNNGGSVEEFIATDANGAQSVQVSRADRWNAATLEDAGMVFSDLIPDANGNIVLSVGDVSNAYYPLNALVLEANAREGDVPEPATMALLGLAAAGLGGYVRRRRRA